jgi:CHRD domain
MRSLLVLAVGVASLIAVFAAPMVAGDGTRRFQADLDGFAETPQTISTSGRGTFTARLDGESLTFRLRFRDLSGPPTQAHIHFGAPATSGGISVWLCGSATNNHPTQPATCPTSSSGEVVATVSSANVVGPSGQGIAPGEFEELVRAMRAGVTYANVHTTLFPTGEIRGRIGRADDD